MKVTVNLTDNVFQKLKGIRKEVAEATAGIIAQGFEEMLKDAPQWSGNFVANMAITSGERIGTKTAELFPIPKNASEAMARGDTPAINRAKENNKTIVKNFTRAITRGAGWVPPTITIYNRLDYAEIAEDLSSTQLRPINSAGAHPMEKLSINLEYAARRLIQYGSPEFISYRESGRNPLE